MTNCERIARIYLQTLKQNGLPRIIQLVESAERNHDSNTELTEVILAFRTHTASKSYKNWLLHSSAAPKKFVNRRKVYIQNADIFKSMSKVSRMGS